MGSPEMSQSYGSRIAKAVGRILAVALISFFVWQVVIAAGKLQVQCIRTSSDSGSTRLILDRFL